jgi:hypothetical protein
MTNNTRVIFVFGSNLAGRHGKGAAWCAADKWGAKYGVGRGITGDAYAIPTKDKNLKVIPLSKIKDSVVRFIDFAEDNPNLLFYVTAFGTGLAGYKIEEIKELFGDFSELPYNIVFTKDWFN